MTKIKKGIVALSAILLTASASVVFSAPAHGVPPHGHTAVDGEGDWPVPRPRP